MNLDKLKNIKVEDIKLEDYPEFCDAYISHAEIDGRELTDDELSELNTNQSFINQQAHASLI